MAIVNTEVPITSASSQEMIQSLTQTYPFVRTEILTTTAFQRPVSTLVLGKGGRSPGGISGVTPYPMIGTNFVYAAPTCAGGHPRIYPTDPLGLAVIISNNSLRQSFADLVDRPFRLTFASEFSKHRYVNSLYIRLLRSTYFTKNTP